ncbi:hypothetical protein B1992_11420 [Pseudoxanthomonas broegbernensis]|uniref:Uncharacterized protein n=1 Tax=Pseudoxanthomonas broegbernensis TaxID=83619 RepID=A0A7V8GL52_9GAMM|nr:hypothetical protein B1992_11420 [Pseudoxanthomonas broegbernensis]MBB6065941.1 hypothetical protein [Pseudoxanthomonas broegbernensis]
MRRTPVQSRTASAPLPWVLRRMEEMAIQELDEAARLAPPSTRPDPLDACLAWDMAGPVQAESGAGGKSPSGSGAGDPRHPG